PDVFNLLLQVMDEGRLTDGKGRTVDFRHSVIILTSNIGSQQIYDCTGDLESIRPQLMQLLQSYFRPEFLNRLDDIILFHRLDEQQISQIVVTQLGVLAQRLAQQDISVEFSEALVSYIAKAGFDPQFGARPLKRVIQREIEDALARALLSGTVVPSGRIMIDYDDQIRIRQIPA
ncbi:MAG TPA: AAA family ATPase, partial [Candidatus Cloacimonadota bacterium]|nr:AAA family ATPase [Candidatus Cloacimonadota bacterium]